MCHRTGPPRTRDPAAMLTMEKLYDTADVFALGVMFRHLLRDTAAADPAGLMSPSHTPTKKRSEVTVRPIDASLMVLVVMLAVP